MSFRPWSAASVRTVRSEAEPKSVLPRSGGRGALTLSLIALSLCAACKVEVRDIYAAFKLAEATWFEDEQTLFFFYRVEAQQGIGPESEIEVTYRTDEAELPWTALTALTPVHEHLAIDCGADRRCGSFSLPVRLAPRQVGVRLRYHREGELALNAKVSFNAVRSGGPRSLIVYGVFDEPNAHVQWRARHQFPSLRNHQVEELGLRRFFRVEDMVYGTLPEQSSENLYGYGDSPSCAGGLMALGFAPVETSERAVFAVEALPLSASTASGVCARATVRDATGTFTTSALARKNPEVHPAFPVLRNPNRAQRQVRFLLKPCTRVISEQHLAMQEQRLLFDMPEVVCTEEAGTPEFAAGLAAKIKNRLDTERIQGEDMLLVLALHHDDSSGRFASVIETALERVLPAEEVKGSPRVTGAFVLDSTGHQLQRGALKRLVLWCPALLSDESELGLDEAQRSCPQLAELPDLKLGPFRLGSIPILPSRDRYERFVAKYSEAQAGKTKSLEFLAPQRTPLSETVQLGEFGSVTFFNNEAITATAADAFSYCPDERPPVVFRTAPGQPPRLLSELPALHASHPQAAYPLGVLWDFPFLTHLEYEMQLAAAATVFSVTVPFGIASSSKDSYGARIWEQDEIPLENALLQCTRFCLHPTFDSSGVYNAGSLFKDAYLSSCYRPKYPLLSDGGFPSDP